MIKRSKKFTYIAALLCSLLIAFVTLLTTYSGARYARAAASSVVAAYESSNVWDDLQTAMIDGNIVDLSLYNFDESKNVKVLSFIEFCYSFQSYNQTDYGLYVYVYNPHGYDWTKKPELNKISFRSGGKSTANFEKYSLQYLNHSTAAGYEGLFYKFKIALSYEQRAEILSSLNSSERIYEISEIELYSSGTNATAYDVSNKYTYKGYAKGYGSESAYDNTLSCTSDGLMTLTLDVHGATFRPDGNNGNSKYTQDMLHSVYFSIPNEVIENYGGLSAVHATWLNATTAPIFVTGNEEVYNQVYNDIFNNGGAPSNATSDGFALLVNGVKYEMGPPLGSPDTFFYTADLAYNVSKIVSYATVAMFTTQRYGIQFSQTLNNLYYCFLADGNADTYTLKGSEVLKYMQTYTDMIASNSELVAGKYNSQLFNFWDKEFTDVNIHADDNYSLKNEVWSQNFFEKLFGTHTVEVSAPFNGIKAIHEVQSSDFKSKEADTCKGLFIDQSYYQEFKAFYDKSTKANETVYLFRYYQSEYVSKEVTECQIDKNNSTTGEPAFGDIKYGLDPRDTNAYMAQEVVHLDFDIIDVTCTKGEVETVIPCVSAPKDLIPDVTPPIEVTSDNHKNLWEKFIAFCKWLEKLTGVSYIIWAIIFLAVPILILIGIFAAIFPNFRRGLMSVLKNIGKGLIWLLKGLWWLICAPFRLLASLFRRRKTTAAKKSRPRKARNKSRSKKK